MVEHQPSKLRVASSRLVSRFTLFMLKIICLIMVTGALATSLRVSFMILMQRFFTTQFPLATFFINIFGCFLAGLCFCFSEQFNWSYTTKISIFSGFLAAFTTFSAFGLETFLLFQKNAYFMAVSYVVSSNIFGVFCCYLGYKFSKFISIYF